MSTRLTTARSRAALVAVSGILGVAYLVSLATYDVTNDAQTTALTSWRIAETGSPWLDGYDYSVWEPGANKLWVGQAANGHLVGFRSPGPVAAAVPAYAVARAFGATDYAIAPGSITATLLTLAAMALLFLALRDRVGVALATGAALAVGLTTPVWSVSADSLYTHPVTLLGIAGMAWAMGQERWWLVGLFGGVALWGRLHAALIVALLGLGVTLVRRQPRIALQVGSISATMLGLAYLWGYWVYGTWSPAGGYSVAGYTDRALGATDPLAQVKNHLGLWIAPDRGILVWTPVLVLLLPAVLRSWRSLPDHVQWLAGAGVAYTLVQGQLNGFTGGSGFYGYRLTLELLMCLTPAFVASLPRAGRWARALLGPLLGLQFAAISVGAAGEGGMLLETRAWTDNSFVHAMATVPALAVWPLLTIAVGWLGGRAVLRGVEQRNADASDVSPSDDLDRV